MLHHLAHPQSHMAIQVQLDDCNPPSQRQTRLRCPRARPAAAIDRRRVLTIKSASVRGAAPRQAGAARAHRLHLIEAHAKLAIATAVAGDAQRSPQAPTAGPRPVLRASTWRWQA